MDNLIKERVGLLKLPKIGDIIKGKVVGRSKSSVFVDLGNWGAGTIFGKEFLVAKEILRKLKKGDELFVKIVDLENDQGFWELSALEADREISWIKLSEKKQANESLTVKILGANEGGLLTTVFGINAFLPVSQLSSKNYPRVEDGDTSKILRELQKFVDQEMEVKILDLDQKQDKLILSEKIKETEQMQKILKNYKVGDIVEGEITGVVDFGAFVKFPVDRSSKKTEEKADQLEGLVHISELDWQLIENPGDIVKVGERVKLKIIDISNGKVSLSLRALKKDPWQSLGKEFEKGKIIKGKVTKLNPFGAFVQIMPRIQGLCHISEFTSGKNMEESLKIGFDYDFEILLIDAKEHRLLLKLKQ